MKTFPAFVVFTLLLTITFIPAIQAQTIICDVTCYPNPSSTGYGGIVASRPKMSNARGSSSPIIPRAAVGSRTGAADMVIGSQSYNYAIPILNLPGRAGMDLTLNLYYNSRVWNVDSVNGTVAFNADRDFPSYGFRLDFGYLEYDVTNDQYVLTEGDGTKHTLPNSGNYDSTDGTYMRYTVSQKVLAYRNGHKVAYEVFPSQAGAARPTLFRPIWSEDTNGNFISISYLSGHDQLIGSVTDTLGRVIDFNYDSSFHLSSISQTIQTAPPRPCCPANLCQLYVGNGAAELFIFAYTAGLASFRIGYRCSRGL